ncbi:MAG: CheR family methyltransferase [Rhodomicrobiaceae bacterium]
MSAFASESEAQKSRSFDSLCAYLRRTSGLVLGSDKRYLVESRVTPVMKRAGVSGLTELVTALEQGRMPGLAEEVVQAMTINETYFFRDRFPFDLLRHKILPKMIVGRAPQKKIRIWSAASSTGQEGYSIAMIIEEASPCLASWQVEIVATDLSQNALSTAQKGLYSQFEVQRGLTPEQIQKYFKPVGHLWQLKDNIRSRVQFKHFNLLDSYSSLGKFDIIFCRNVLIYFEPERKADVLNRMAQILAPDGVLAIGASESVIGLNTKLKAHPEYRGFLCHG